MREEWEEAQKELLQKRTVVTSLLVQREWRVEVYLFFVQQLWNR